MSVLGTLASRALAEQVHERLALLEQAAAGVLAHADIAQVRAEMVVLIAAWRVVLKQHEADERGRCPQCRGWLRRRRWPCRVWREAHRFVTDHPVGRRRSGLGPR